MPAGSSETRCPGALWWRGGAASSDYAHLISFEDSYRQERSSHSRTQASTRDSTIGSAALSHPGCSMCRFWSRYKTLSETPASPDPSIARSLTCSRLGQSRDEQREARCDRHGGGQAGRGRAAPCPRWPARSVRPSHRPRAARRPAPAARGGGAAPGWPKAVRWAPLGGQFLGRPQSAAAASLFGIHAARPSTERAT